MKCVKLHGTHGTRTVQIEPDQRFTTPRFGKIVPPKSESAAITPNPPTSEELQAEATQAVVPAFTQAYAENRPRLIAYLTAGFHNNMSEGVALHEFADAVETQYAPRKIMTPDQWRAFTEDLQAEDYNSVDWIASLQTRLYRKYEDMRPPTPLVEPQGAIKVYLCDPQDSDMLIYAYDELPDNYQHVWQRYARKYNCPVRIETEAGTITINSGQAETEVA